MKDIHNMI